MPGVTLSSKRLHGQSPATGKVAAVVKDQVPPAVTDPPIESVPVRVAVYVVLKAKADDGVNVALRVAESYAVVPATVPEEDFNVSWTLDAVTGLENTALTLVLTETLEEDG